MIHRLIWDERNISHIAKHNVTPSEAEKVCYSPKSIVYRRGDRYIVLGQTGAGRYLFVVLEFLGKGTARVITARDMDKKERRLYHRVRR